ncbi:MAG: YciI family protein [Actinomycetota bacterium]
MKYACLIYSAESGPGTPEPGTQAHDEMVAGYFKFNQDVIDAGIYLAGEPLESIESATSVQVKDGDVITTDGPFAETKEQLGGFYILECESLDEAIAWAARIPTATYGTIEVRPVPTFEMGPDGAGG